MNNKITVVDARMGRGKTSAAIRYMNRYRGGKRFLYITPYLDEVGRICEQCDFDQSDGDYSSKSAELKYLLRDEKNVAATHALFYLLDEEALEIVRQKHYSLIIDESINIVAKLYITNKDLALVTEKFTEEDADGFLYWTDSDYTGRFCDYKRLAETRSLRRLDTALLNIMHPDMLRSFDEVFMLTYLFDGQYQKAYLDYFGFEYRIVGVEKDEDGYRFSDMADAPPCIDYSRLIDIVDTPRMNRPGNEEFALSKNWFAKRGYNHHDIKALRNSMKGFFQDVPGGSASTRLWTSFKDAQDKLVDARTGRFRRNFLQVGARATNEYRDRTDVAYLANRFADPNLMKLFASKGIVIDSDKFALSEMLQWIWRSAIRDDRHINLYIPSRRMRGLLIKWMDEMNGGNTVAE